MKISVADNGWLQTQGGSYPSYPNTSLLHARKPIVLRSTLFHQSVVDTLNHVHQNNCHLIKYNWYKCHSVFSWLDALLILPHNNIVHSCQFGMVIVVWYRSSWQHRSCNIICFFLVCFFIVVKVKHNGQASTILRRKKEKKIDGWNFHLWGGKATNFVLKRVFRLEHLQSPTSQ